MDKKYNTQVPPLVELTAPQSVAHWHFNEMPFEKDIDKDSTKLPFQRNHLSAQEIMLLSKCILDNYVLTGLHVKALKIGILGFYTVPTTFEVRVNGKTKRKKDAEYYHEKYDPKQQLQRCELKVEENYALISWRTEWKHKDWEACPPEKLGDVFFSFEK